ncbi:MAG TPA: radical SAM protein [Bryobacteraceae bacterium]
MSADPADVTLNITPKNTEEFYTRTSLADRTLALGKSPGYAVPGANLTLSLGEIAVTNLVTLVNSNQVKPAVAPIGLDYLFEPLRRAGFEPEMLDLCFCTDIEQEISQYCHRRKPAFWGVTMRNTDDVYFSNQHSFVDTVRFIINALRAHSNVPIVMGGVGFSVMPETIMELCGVDFGIVCEGEVSFPELLKRLSMGQPYEDIPGLVYRTDQGIRRNAVSFADLSSVGSRSRTGVDNHAYFLKGGLAAVETKRGCTRPCIYCVEPLVKGKKIRLRNPKDAVDEIENLVRQGAYAIHINDSEFNLDVPHAIAFCKEMIARRMNRCVEWYAYGMPSPFPESLAAHMKEAGCVGMNFGTDSASEKMLRVLMRTFRPKHIEAAVNLCKKYGLRHIVEILFGAPGEDADTVRETITFLKTLNPELVSVTAGLRVFPGTALESMVRKQGMMKDNPNLYGAVGDNDNLLKPVFFLSSEIGPKPLEYIGQLVGDDRRFFGVNSDQFNYNANQLLVDAIANGARGAYWMILSALNRDAPPSNSQPQIPLVQLAPRAVLQAS